jgi:23S rRNA pseudouridine1911/1915/1917 synthase
MSKRLIDVIVPEELHQHRADVVMAKLFPEFSRNQWIDWLKDGLISCQNKPLIPKQKLNAQSQVTGEIPLDTVHTEAVAQDIPLSIVYEDDDLIVVNKPAGLVVHPGAGQSDSTLMNALLFHHQFLETLPRAGIIHRLDKDTSGLLIIAKNSASYQTLVQMMANREIDRQYLALVHGCMISGGTIETFYGRHPKQRLKMAVRASGRIAITHYLVAESFHQNTLLKVKLETGRTHQIRVHLSHKGFPIVGDPLYGKNRAPGNGPASIALNQFPRQALHAAFLNFIHPITQKPLTFHANLPDDFALLLSVLREG